MIEEIKDCRSCGAALSSPFLDLGTTPLANSYVKNFGDSENYYQLAVVYCHKCHLVQLTHTVQPENLYSEYAYCSSYSSSFLEHTKEFVETIKERLKINTVLEIASNDGYLLQYFKPYTHIKTLGIEPAKNIAKIANDKGIATLDKFFNTDLVSTIVAAFGLSDLIIGNNVLAHVPDINDFVSAVDRCLSPQGWATFEFPYLPMMVNKLEFDTIYHEHVFYYSVLALNNLFKRHNMQIIDIKFSEIHGGSIRIFACHKGRWQASSIVSFYEMTERLQGVDTIEYYEDFTNHIYDIKVKLRNLLESLKWRDKSIAAYGAPAKGNTLLNYCNIGRGTIDFTVDISPHKQGLLLPGTQIPIYPREYLLEHNPDYTLLLPWNFSEEICEQQKDYLAGGGHFIVPVPEPRIII